MTSLVSLVGRQPASVARVVAAMAKNSSSPLRVTLLATDGVRHIAERLVQWCEKRGVEATVRAISTETYEGAELRASDVARDVIAKYESSSMPHGRGDDVVFNLSAGLGYQTTMIGMSLPVSVPVVNAGAKVVVYRRTPDGFSAECEIDDGIGEEADDALASDDFLVDLDDLIELHGIRPPKFDRERPKNIKTLLGDTLTACDIDDRVIPLNTMWNLDFGEGVQFDMAFVRRGFLEGMVVVESPASETKTTLRTLLARARGLDALRDRLNGLEPRVWVLTNHLGTARRLLTTPKKNVIAASPDIRTFARELRLGREWRTEPAFRSFFSARSLDDGNRDIDVALDAATRRHYPDVRGRGGIPGRRLAVALGLDRSPTLSALATHRPEEAWVFYDPASPEITNLVSRAADFVADLPVGAVRFQPTDPAGAGMPHVIAEAERRGPLDANISPGTKLQGLVLASAVTGGVWSLDRGRECAAKYGTGDERGFENDRGRRGDESRQEQSRKNETKNGIGCPAMGSGSACCRRRKNDCAASYAAGCWFGPMVDSIGTWVRRRGNGSERVDGKRRRRETRLHGRVRRRFDSELALGDVAAARPEGRLATDRRLVWRDA